MGIYKTHPLFFGILLSVFSSAIANATTFVDVCSRTQQVRDGISLTLKKQCAEITESDLKKVFDLDLNANSVGSAKIETLKVDDLQGLTALELINLQSNRLATLPEKFFSDTRSLTDIYLGYNRLTVLPDGLFNGLSKLKVLELGFNQLNEVSAELFKGLFVLNSLDLEYNRLSGLSRGVFEDQKNLIKLWLGHNSFPISQGGMFKNLGQLQVLALDHDGVSGFGTGFFQGLKSLRWLDLESNHLNQLPQGSFQGLARIEWINLKQNNLENLGKSYFSKMATLQKVILSSEQQLSFVKLKRPVPLKEKCDAVSRIPNLKYFGLYCSSCGWVGEGSYTDEVKDFSNLIWISGDLTWTLSELKKADLHHLHAIVSMMPEGFPGVTGLAVGKQTPAQWSRIAEELRPFVENGSIVGFYLADDTFSPSVQEVERQIRILKRSFPGVATAAILDAVPSALPKGLDWVGMELYACWDGLCNFSDAHANQVTHLDLRKKYKKLKAMLNPSQSILLVPNISQIHLDTPGVVMSTAAVKASIDEVLSLGAHDPQVIGITPFLWQSMKRDPLNPFSENLTGARDLSGFRQRIVELGKCTVH